MKRQFLPRIIKACIKSNLDKKSNNSTTYNILTLIRLKAIWRTVISIISEKRTGNPSIEGRSNIKPEKIRRKVYYHKSTAKYSKNHHYRHHHYLHIIIIIISSYHHIQNPNATFRRILINVPGKVRFIMGFDINPGTFGRIRPKVACQNFPWSYYHIIISSDHHRSNSPNAFSRKWHPPLFEEFRQTSRGNGDS